MGASGHSNPRAATPCCPYYHQAIELVGKRWTGAIVAVLLHSPKSEPESEPESERGESHGLRFSEIAQAVPELSDRLLSERMKELEARGIVQRTVHPGPPVRVEYALTDMGRALLPALSELKAWARDWLREPVAVRVRARSRVM